jgi:hypothetical protein
MLCPAELWPAADPPVPLPLLPAGPGVPPVEVPAVGEGPAPPPAVAAPLEPAVGGLGVASGSLSEPHATSAKPARSAVPQAARARDGRRCRLLVTWVPIEKAQRARRRRSWEQVEHCGEGCEWWEDRAGRSNRMVREVRLRSPHVFAGFDADRCHVIFSATCQIHLEISTVEQFERGSRAQGRRKASSRFCMMAVISRSEPVEAVFDDSALGPGAVVGKQRQHVGNHILGMDVDRVAVRRGRALALLEPGPRSQAR